MTAAKTHTTAGRPASPSCTPATDTETVRPPTSRTALTAAPHQALACTIPPPAHGADAASQGDLPLTSTNLSLDLYDMAGQIDRLRFQLQALPAAPEIPGIESVFACADDLVGITAAVNTQIRHCLPELLHHNLAKAALMAYSSTLAPLGEALTEFGRMQAEITYYNSATHPRHRDSPSDLELARQQVNDVVTGCCEAADEILEATATELRDAAIMLAPSPSRLRPAAPDRDRLRPSSLTGSRSGLGLATVPPPMAPAGANGRPR